MTLAFDRAASSRSFDDNGFMRVASSHITKTTVNPYYGRDIPGWRELKLDPEKIYYGLRDPRELQKSVATWEGLPLYIEHHPDSADDPEIRTRVGAVGRARWANPYVDAPLYIWNQAAIYAIEDGSFRELSCAYRYTPDFTPGKYEGVDYDFVMRNIRGNHVALEEEGRAGFDVLVADAALDGKEDDGWITAENGKKVHMKDGKVDKGNIGQKNFSYKPTPLKSTAPDMALYKELLKKNEGDYTKAARDYFREDLQGKCVEAMTDDGPIEATFTGASWQELKKGMKGDPLKAELIPYMPEIISSGEYYKNELYKNRSDGTAVFHTYRKKIETSQGLKDVIVDVAEKTNPYHDQAKYQVYNLTREGTSNYVYRNKKSSARDSGLSLNLAEDSFDDSNIKPQYEVVNIRFADEKSAQVAKDKKPNKPGGIMKKIKKWFGGAKDSNPEIEREEVDLAQAIIDLHKVNPETGEIVDITEDEDKAGEIRKIIGEISGKLDPDELKKLTDALGDLAYSKATGDSDPDKPGGMDEKARKAMDSCGLDVDNPELVKVFAGE